MSNRRPIPFLSDLLSADIQDEDFLTPTLNETNEKFCDQRLLMQERLLQAYAHADEWAL